MSSVEQFNEQYPIGSEFIYIPTKTDAGVGNGLSVKTTSEAWDMCGEPCVKVTGQAGGVSISHLVAAQS